MNNSNWYVLSTFPQMEKIVQRNIESNIKRKNLQDYVLRIDIPNLTLSNTGIVLIQMIYTDEVWYTIRNTPMITGFLGDSNGGSKPIPISKEEVEALLLNNK